MSLGRIFSPQRLVIFSIIMGFMGLLLLVFNCSKGEWSSAGEIKNTVEKFVKENLGTKEQNLRKKEQMLDKRLSLLGISLIDYLNFKSAATVYVITPTHTRLTQKADLTRLSQTLLHIPKLHWIVIEDSVEKTSLVERLLKGCGLSYTHLAVKTSKRLIRGEGEPRWLKARGVEQRNLGLQWLQKHFDSVTMKGVVYFADDDNTYDIKLFEQMRQTKAVSVWPVGLVGGLKWEGPICKNGKVIKFYTAWKPSRPFPVDMAGFAINAKLIVDNPDVKIDPDAERGYLESSILEKLVKRENLEPLANNCKQILVWHTQTAEPKMKQEAKLRKMGKHSDPSLEV